MDPGLMEQAEVLLNSGKMSPADAAALRGMLNAAKLEAGGGSESMNEARTQRLEDVQDETSVGTVLKNTASELGERAKGIGRGLKKLGQIGVGMSPLGSMISPESGQAADRIITDPAARREVGRGLSDTLFGYPSKISDAIRKATGGEATYAPNEEADAQAAPDYRTAAMIGGSMVPGTGVNVLGRGAVSLASKLPSAGRMAVSPTLKATAAGMGASGAYGAAHADAGDAGDRGRAALSLASDPLNLAVPATFKALSKARQAGRGLTAKMRDETSALGGGADTLQALDTMREEGRLTGNLKRTVKDPELEALPIGKKGYAKASRKAVDTIGENTTADRKQARADYDKEISAIEAEHADKAYPVENLKSRLGKLREENAVNGEPVDDQLAAALDKVDRMTTKKTGILARSGGEIEASAATVADLIKVKKAVGDKAQFGMPATPENRPYRLIWKELALEAEGIDPRIKPLNQKYGAAMTKLEETNDILYGKDAPEVADRPAAKKRAAGAIMRVDDDTTAGVLGDESLDRLAELDPRNAKAIQKVKEKKAIERTRFGLPQMSKSPEKWGTGLVEQNAEALRARVVDPIARWLGQLGLDPAAQALVRARLAAQEQQ